MLFKHPTQDIKFEIPDEWLIVANVENFYPTDRAFISSSDPAWPTTLVPLNSVTAPIRDLGIAGLDRDRTISLLRAFSQQMIVPPIVVHTPPNSDLLSVRDGYHRYYISIALGFTLLPVSIRPYFDFNSL